MSQQSLTFYAPAPGEASRLPGSAEAEARALEVELTALGLVPGLVRSAAGVTAGGADLELRPRELARSSTATGRFLVRLAALLDDGVPVTLSLVDPGGGGNGIRTLETFCSDIRRALGGDEQLLSGIGLSLYSHQLPLQAYMVTSRALLGAGPRYVMLDSLQMRPHAHAGIQQETERNWVFLWRQRKLEHPLRAAYAGGIRSGTPLLADEAAQAILPMHGLQVPAGSGWLPIVLPLTRFADAAGRIDWEQLQAALEAAVDLGDQLLEILSWPTAGQRSDAWLNRRLGILPTGMGELVRMRGEDPRALGCLHWTHDCLRRIRRIVWDRSQALAHRAGMLPALARSDPSGGLGDHAHRQNWQRRWRLALAESAVRHRNLLVLSPYSVLPERGEATAAYTDLLPVLCHADAFAFGGQARLHDFGVDDFRRFHTRAWAVMRRRHARSLIAAGV